MPNSYQRLPCSRADLLQQTSWSSRPDQWPPQWQQGYQAFNALHHLSNKINIHQPLLAVAKAADYPTKLLRKQQIKLPA
jgi:hypothetical protein